MELSWLKAIALMFLGVVNINTRPPDPPLELKPFETFSSIPKLQKCIFPWHFLLFRFSSVSLVSSTCSEGCSSSWSSFGSHPFGRWLKGATHGLQDVTKMLRKLFFENKILKTTSRTTQLPGSNFTTSELMFQKAKLFYKNFVKRSSFLEHLPSDLKLKSRFHFEARIGSKTFVSERDTAF